MAVKEPKMLTFFERKRKENFFKKVVIAGSFLLALFSGCEIEEELDRCESIINKKINELEASVKEECLTRDEVIEILISMGYQNEFERQIETD